MSDEFDLDDDYGDDAFESSQLLKEASVAKVKESEDELALYETTPVVTAPTAEADAAATDAILVEAAVAESSPVVEPAVTDSSYSQPITEDQNHDDASQPHADADVPTAADPSSFAFTVVEPEPAPTTYASPDYPGYLWDSIAQQWIEDPNNPPDPAYYAAQSGRVSPMKGNAAPSQPNSARVMDSEPAVDVMTSSDAQAEMPPAQFTSTLDATQQQSSNHTDSHPTSTATADSASTPAQQQGKKQLHTSSTTSSSRSMHVLNGRRPRVRAHDTSRAARGGDSPSPRRSYPTSAAVSAAPSQSASTNKLPAIGSHTGKGFVIHRPAAVNGAATASSSTTSIQHTPRAPAPSLSASASMIRPYDPNAPRPRLSATVTSPLISNPYHPSSSPLSRAAAYIVPIYKPQPVKRMREKQQQGGLPKLFLSTALNEEEAIYGAAAQRRPQQQQQYDPDQESSPLNSSRKNIHANGGRQPHPPSSLNGTMNGTGGGRKSSGKRASLKNSDEEKEDAAAASTSSTSSAPISVNLSSSYQYSPSASSTSLSSSSKLLRPNGGIIDPITGKMTYALPRKFTLHDMPGFEFANGKEERKSEAQKVREEKEKKRKEEVKKLLEQQRRQLVLAKLSQINSLKQEEQKKEEGKKEQEKKEKDEEYRLEREKRSAYVKEQRKKIADAKRAEKKALKELAAKLEVETKEREERAAELLKEQDQIRKRDYERSLALKNQKESKQLLLTSGENGTPNQLARIGSSGKKKDAAATQMQEESKPVLQLYAGEEEQKQIDGKDDKSKRKSNKKSDKKQEADESTQQLPSEPTEPSFLTQDDAMHQDEEEENESEDDEELAHLQSESNIVEESVAEASAIPESKAQEEDLKSVEQQPEATEPLTVTSENETVAVVPVESVSSSTVDVPPAVTTETSSTSPTASITTKSPPTSSRRASQVKRRSLVKEDSASAEALSIPVVAVESTENLPVTQVDVSIEPIADEVLATVPQADTSESAFLAESEDATPIVKPLVEATLIEPLELASIVNPSPQSSTSTARSKQSSTASTPLSSSRKLARASQTHVSQSPPVLSRVSSVSSKRPGLGSKKPSLATVGGGTHSNKDLKEQKEKITSPRATSLAVASLAVIEADEKKVETKDEEVVKSVVEGNPSTEAAVAAPITDVLSPAVAIDNKPTIEQVDAPSTAATEPVAPAEVEATPTVPTPAVATAVEPIAAESLSAISPASAPAPIVESSKRNNFDESDDYGDDDFATSMAEEANKSPAVPAVATVVESVPEAEVEAKPEDPKQEVTAIESAPNESDDTTEKKVESADSTAQPTSLEQAKEAVPTPVVEVAEVVKSIPSRRASAVKSDASEVQPVAPAESNEVKPAAVSRRASALAKSSSPSKPVSRRATATNGMTQKMDETPATVQATSPVVSSRRASSTKPVETVATVAEVAGVTPAIASISAAPVSPVVSSRRASATKPVEVAVSSAEPVVASTTDAPSTTSKSRRATAVTPVSDEAVAVEPTPPAPVAISQSRRSTLTRSVVIDAPTKVAESSTRRSSAVKPIPTPPTVAAVSKPSSRRTTATKAIEITKPASTTSSPAKPASRRVTATQPVVVASTPEIVAPRAASPSKSRRATATKPVEVAVAVPVVTDAPAVETVKGPAETKVEDTDEFDIDADLGDATVGDEKKIEGVPAAAVHEHTKPAVESKEATAAKEEVAAPPVKNSDGSEMDELDAAFAKSSFAAAAEAPITTAKPAASDIDLDADLDDLDF